MAKESQRYYSYFDAKKDSKWYAVVCIDKKYDKFKDKMVSEQEVVVAISDSEKFAVMYMEQFSKYTTRLTEYKVTVITESYLHTCLQDDILNPKWDDLLLQEVSCRGTECGYIVLTAYEIRILMPILQAQYTELKRIPILLGNLSVNVGFDVEDREHNTDLFANTCGVIESVAGNLQTYLSNLTPEAYLSAMCYKPIRLIDHNQ